MKELVTLKTEIQKWIQWAKKEKWEFKKIKELYKNYMTPLERAIQEQCIYQKEKRGRKEQGVYSTK